MPNNSQNKFGLKRLIPADIKRKIRQDCGFGCIQCGNAFIEYAHLDPPFENAKEHDPENMALLCVMCHGRQTRNLISLSTLIKARKSPKALEIGFSSDQLSIEYPVTVAFGSNIHMNPKAIVRTSDGEEWFKIDAPENGSRYPNISAKFFDKTGNVELEIEKNEWKCTASNWDGELVGNQLTIRRGSRKVCVQLRFSPPNHIQIERLKMYLHDTGITVDGSGNATIFHNGGKAKFTNNMFGSNSVFLLPPSKTILPRPSNSRTTTLKCGECQSTKEMYTEHLKSGDGEICDCGNALIPQLTSPMVMRKNSAPPESTPTQPHRSGTLFRPNATSMKIRSSLFSGYDGIDFSQCGELDMKNNRFV